MRRALTWDGESNAMTQNEIDLLHGYLNASLRIEDMSRLQTLLRNRAEARAMLRSLSTVDIWLQMLAATDSGLSKLPGSSRVEPPPRKKIAWRIPLAWAAAFALLGTSAGFLLHWPTVAPEQPAPELTWESPSTDDGWTVPSDALLADAPTAASEWEEISKQPQP